MSDRIFSPKGRKDLVMRKQRKFSTDFKRQVVEEYLSGISTAAQLCRRHSLSSGLLYHWRKQYVKNSFDADSAKEAALEERIGQLEQALGKAHLENEFLKKALHQSYDQSRKKGNSLPTTETLSKPSRGGANS
jgi:transposase